MAKFKNPWSHKDSPWYNEEKDRWYNQHPQSDENNNQRRGVKNVSQAGLDFIARFEGFSPIVYKVDGKGNPTIGFGHELKEGESYPDGITRKQGLKLLRSDAQHFVDIINEHVKVPLNQAQFDALTSYIFNTGSLYGTNLLRNLNASNFKAAAKEMDINSSNGVFMQGLQNRRIAEQKLFNTGMYK